MEKEELIQEIAKLIESDPNAVPLNLTLLDILSHEELVSVKNNLLKSKENRSAENDQWFDELVKK